MCICIQILYSSNIGATTTHLHALQSRIERTCSFTFQPFSHCQEAAILWLVCRFLAGEGCGNLLNYCPQFCGNQAHRRSHRLHSWDPAGHLILVTLRLWIDLSAVGWQQLLLSGIDSQLT